MTDRHVLDMRPACRQVWAEPVAIDRMIKDIESGTLVLGSKDISRYAMHEYRSIRRRVQSADWATANEDPVRGRAGWWFRSYSRLPMVQRLVIEHRLREYGNTRIARIQGRKSSRYASGICRSWSYRRAKIFADRGLSLKSDISSKYGHAATERGLLNGPGKSQSRRPTTRWLRSQVSGPTRTQAVRRSRRYPAARVVRRPHDERQGARHSACIQSTGSRHPGCQRRKGTGRASQVAIGVSEGSIKSDESDDATLDTGIIDEIGVELLRGANTLLHGVCICPPILQHPLQEVAVYGSVSTRGRKERTLRQLDLLVDLTLA